MSSTIDPRERGQILIVFAFSLFVIFGVAALAFDGGLMLLEKRDQQNAADAAALAGARFLPGNHADAVATAEDIAATNGFTDGIGDQTVEVHHPPLSGPNAGDHGYIEVLIGSEKPSLFAGIWGIFSHEVGARAVAANDDEVLGPFGMLSLHPTACAAVDVSGGGVIESNGNIHVNSSCEPNALHVRGSGTIDVSAGVACYVFGGYRQSGAASSSNCDPFEGEQPIPDPYADLEEPPIPTDPDTGDIIYPSTALQVVGTEAIPTGCPGSTDPATHTDPQQCQFNGSYASTTWRLYPGYYPGGIELQAGTFYIEPGIYYLGGGGLRVNGSGASVTSVDPGGSVLGGGVMFFNSDNPSEPGDVVRLNGGDSGVNIYPLRVSADDPDTAYNDMQWNHIVIFQDRDVCEDVILNGASSTMQVRGTIYVPCGEVTATGNSGTVITDQIIAETFKLTGSGGTLQVAFDEEFLSKFEVAGLIE